MFLITSMKASDLFTTCNRNKTLGKASSR